MIGRQSLPSLSPTAHQQTPACVECVKEDFLSCLGAEMDHLLACDCFYPWTWIASHILKSNFSVLLYPEASTATYTHQTKSLL